MLNYQRVTQSSLLPATSNSEKHRLSRPGHESTPGGRVQGRFRPPRPGQRHFDDCGMAMYQMEHQEVYPIQGGAPVR